MLPPTKSDPFTLAYTGLFTLALSNKNLAQHIKPKNRINYSSSDGDKRNVSSADFPELELIAQGGVNNLHATSSSTTCTKTYVWALNTGSMQIDERLNPIQWELFCAMAAFCCNYTALKWNNSAFIKSFNIPDETTNPFTDDERGIRGWSSLLSVEVGMYFKTKDLWANVDLDCLTCK